MKRVLFVLGVATFTLFATTATLAASDEACVLLRNQTGYRLHFSVDERFMCDAPERGSCAACHILLGKHTFKVTADGVQPLISAIDVDESFMVWTITE